MCRLQHARLNSRAFRRAVRFYNRLVYAKEECPAVIVIIKFGLHLRKSIFKEKPAEFTFDRAVNALLNEFMNISGVNVLMRSADLSGGNISGVALQLLIEQDESRLTSSAEEIRNSAKDISKQILRLYKQFAVVSHTSRIVGENGSV